MEATVSPTCMVTDALVHLEPMVHSVNKYWTHALQILARLPMFVKRWVHRFSAHVAPTQQPDVQLTTIHAIRNLA